MVAMKKKKYTVVIIAFLAIILLAYKLHFYQPLESNIKEKYNIYVVYSPTCPHCKNLFSFLDREGIDVKKVSIEEFSTMKIFNNLSTYFRGVPFVFARVNDTILIISGYPSSKQEKDGYFLGKDYEEGLCKEMNGTPIHINDTYSFCELSKNVFLGNKYSILWLIEQCREYGCEKLE